jgi:hypothetical protein
VRDVLAHAGHQCEFTAPGGMRCTARTPLEIERPRPFAIHRSHDERWLRAYCRGHNPLGAGRVFGTELIRARIEERRTLRASPAPRPEGGPFA